MEFGIVVVGFGLMALWVRANESALVYEEYQKEYWRLVRGPEAEEDWDPRQLPLVDDREDSEPDEQPVETSPGKGRYH